MFTSTTQPRNASPKPSPRPSVPESFGLRVRVAVSTTQQFLFGGDGYGPAINNLTSSEHCDPVARTPYHKTIPVRLHRSPS